MSQSPYRTRLSDPPGPPPAERPYGLDAACIFALAWVLGIVRVVGAIMRCEGASRETDLAWLLAIFAPVLVWKEIAARRHAERPSQPSPTRFR